MSGMITGFIIGVVIGLYNNLDSKSWSKIMFFALGLGIIFGFVGLWIDMLISSIKAL